MIGLARRSVSGVGELGLLFWAALLGSMRRPFYWKEFLDQCRFILTANFIPLLLTGVGCGIIVSLEAGHFFKAASSEYRLGGFTVMANIREFSPVATGLMIAAVSGTAIVADLGARQVRQELEALSVMGLSNVLIAVAVVGVNPGAFLASFFTQGTLVDLFGGEIKCILFGALVAAICIYKGISAAGPTVAALGQAPGIVSSVDSRVGSTSWAPGKEIAGLTTVPGGCELAGKNVG